MMEMGGSGSTLKVSQSGRSRSRPVDPLVVASMTFLGILVVAVGFAFAIMPFDPLSQDLTRRNLPPLAGLFNRGVQSIHWLGTDQLGRDLLSRILVAGRTTLFVGVTAAGLAAILGSSVGVAAGYFGGRTSGFIMRAVDVQMAFPTLLLALFVLYALGPGIEKVILVLAVTRWPVFARVGRSLTLACEQMGFVVAARVIGANSWRVIFRHVVPNVVGPLLVLASLEVAVLMLAESSLSFLGLGLQPPATSWGVMISGGRPYLASAWWIVVVPGLVLFLTALSLNVLGSWLRARSLARLEM